MNAFTDRLLRAVATGAWLAAVLVTVLCCMWFLPEILRPCIAFAKRVIAILEKIKKHAENKIKEIEEREAKKNQDESDDHKCN